jgi:hypothetical protein
MAGYHTLHKMARSGGQDLATSYRKPNDPGMVPENDMDGRFGFLRLQISGDIIDLHCISVPRPQESWSKAPKLFDPMRYSWRKRTIIV